MQRLFSPETLSLSAQIPQTVNRVTKSNIQNLPQIYVSIINSSTSSTLGKCHQVVQISHLLFPSRLYCENFPLIPMKTFFASRTKQPLHLHLHTLFYIFHTLYHNHLHYYHFFSNNGIEFSINFAFLASFNAFSATQLFSVPTVVCLIVRNGSGFPVDISSDNSFGGSKINGHLMKLCLGDFWKTRKTLIKG